MLFDTFAFAGFLSVVIAVFFCLPRLLRPLWLAAASYYFYTYSHPEFWWLLLTCTSVAYLGGLAIERWTLPWQRRTSLLAGCAVNLALLFYYKYADFAFETANSVLGAVHSPSRLRLLHPVLPLGISFFTFQALSYLFDVYRGHFPAEHRFDIFAAYKAFFPQLVAGPIERPGNVIPQLHRRSHWDFERFTSGLRLILWGTFKKLVIADRLAIPVREAYGAPSAASSLQLLVATYAFAWEIYCDFSAYTDIARGCSRILGIELMENFQNPYGARSIPEFWQRWHISLSTWFRDYLYIPLGGNRNGAWHLQRNILIVFLVSGLWHGAEWKFVIWGLIHGIVFLVSRALPKSVTGGVDCISLKTLLRTGIQVFVTFHIVCFAWIFFRASSCADAIYILAKICRTPFRGPLWDKAFTLPDVLIALAGILVLLGVQSLRARGGAFRWLSQRPVWIRWSAYYALIVATFLLSERGQQEFIYFHF